MLLKALSIGAVLWDVIGDNEYIGGAPYNLAVHLARLGNQAALLTRLGRDARGERAFAHFKHEKIDTCLVQWDTQMPTGIAQVTFSLEGEPSYYLPISAYDAIENMSTHSKNVITWHPDCICFGTIEQRSETTRQTIHSLLDSTTACRVFYDVNIRMNFIDLLVIDYGCKKADILKMNEGEYHLLSKLIFECDLNLSIFAERIAHKYVIQIVIITLGEIGCAVWYQDILHILYAKKVNCIDPIGAGDAFSAGFLHALYLGCTPEQAAKCGNLLGGYVASYSGALPVYNDEIKREMTSLIEGIV